ncbi:antitoxin Xre/MbcA/ParS toxin-binding domain-containing protein [Azonexus sp. IMCC34839]|uniref:antitoxin Xre/MbcA/ParS toxin-binding domain-containing protein n=1 Tax=Azonexus sp. IMCC34839 TaxID=3133695 RepID=UPI0039996E83
MREKTYLDTADGMAGYAKRYGAKYDSERCAWFVDGEVPNELLGLIPKKRNPSVHLVALSCPLCGSHMVERVRKSDKQPFWGCSRFPACKGIVDYERYLESQDGEAPKAVKEFLSTSVGDANANPKLRSTSSSMSLQRRMGVRRIVVLATKVLGGVARAERWLSSPKVTLKGKSPLEIMGDEEGCFAVEKLLISIQE